VRVAAARAVARAVEATVEAGAAAREVASRVAITAVVERASGTAGVHLVPVAAAAVPSWAAAATKVDTKEVACSPLKTATMRVEAEMRLLAALRVAVA
jgi:hypothetical protein